MGNQTSTASEPTSSSGKDKGKRSASSRGSNSHKSEEEVPATATARAKKVVADVRDGIKNSVRDFDDDHPAAQLLDQMCGGALFDPDPRYNRSASFYSEMSEDDTYDSASQYTDDRSRRSSRMDKSIESASMMSDETDRKAAASNTTGGGKDRRRHNGTSSSNTGNSTTTSFDTEEESKLDSSTGEPQKLLSKPLASSFAKRCYFTKAGIGKTTQHYEGLTLTGNVVLMLATSMKLKGCPTICDEDLRRVEQTYPNQFSRLPDELLLSSGWRRISKYCHFSNKAVPDGIPFFHSKQRIHPSGGYFFLLASAVGMARPIDVEPLNRDTLVLLETDFPQQCDAAPSMLVKDPEQWVLVDRFCFFSGGPINTEEDVYYQADFDGNAIFMLAFLSPSLTPEELYKLGEEGPNEMPGLQTMQAVHDVESVYDLTDRDFDDLKLYHLGPCRALPQYILQPQAWMKVLPPHFLAARQEAMMKAQKWEAICPPPTMDTNMVQQVFSADGRRMNSFSPTANPISPGHASVGGFSSDFQREVEEEGAFGEETLFEDATPFGDAPMDEAMDSRSAMSGHNMESPISHGPQSDFPDQTGSGKLDPPEDEPPSLVKSGDEGQSYQQDPSEQHQGREVEAHYETENVNTSGLFDNIVTDDPRHPAQTPGGEESLGFFTAAAGSHRQAEEDPFYNHRMEGNASQNSSVDRSAPNLHIDTGGFDEQEYQTQGAGAPLPIPESTHQNALNLRSEAEALDPRYHVVSSPSSHHSFSPPLPDHPTGHFQMAPPDDDALYRVDEEKKRDDAEQAANPVTPRGKYSMSVDSEKSGEGDFIPIKRDGYVLGSNNNTSMKAQPHSTDGNSVSTSSPSHTSSALRGAQEILKRNRRRRNTNPTVRIGDGGSVADVSDPGTPTLGVDTPKGTWETGSEVTNSVASGASSVWSENSGPGDQGSRRALILQMAKARMKTHKSLLAASPTKSSHMRTTAIVEADEPDSNMVRVPPDANNSSNFRKQSDAQTDIDIRSDLD